MRERSVCSASSWLHHTYRHSFPAEAFAVTSAPLALSSGVPALVQEDEVDDDATPTALMSPGGYFKGMQGVEDASKWYAMPC